MKRIAVLLLAATVIVCGVLCVKTIITPVTSESVTSSFEAEQVTPATSSTQSDSSTVRFYDDSSSPCGTGIATNRLVIPELTDGEIADEVGQLNEGYGYDVIYEEATEALVVIPTEDRIIDESADGEDDEEDIGPAIWVNPETDCYETSDGTTWPKEEDVDTSVTGEPFADSSESPIEEEEDIGPAIWVNPETDCYETSDGATWPKEEDVDKSATDEPVIDDEGPIVDGDPRTDEGLPVL